MNTLNKNSNIWYKNYMVTVFVIGLPLFVVITCIFFIIYAIKHQDTTVRDDWYMDGKALYQDASKDQLAYDLGIFGVMRFDNEQVVFELNYPKQSTDTGKLNNGVALYYPKTLTVNISHATNKNKDRDFILTHTNGNRYTGQVSLDTTIPAKYYLQVSTPKDEPNQWRLIHAQQLPATNIPFTPLKAFAHQWFFQMTKIPNTRHYVSWKCNVYIGVRGGR